MTPLLTASALAGLVGSPHCVGMCGGFAVAASRRPSEAVAWHLGRLSTYAVLGAIAGAAGRAIPGPAWVAGLVSTILIVLFALDLAGVVKIRGLRIPGIARLGARLAGRTGPAGRYAFGAATSLLPCGLAYAALALPLSTGSALQGALVMVAFGLGTVPFLAVASAGLQRLAARGIWHRRALAGLVLLFGLSAVFLRVGPTLAAQGDPPPPACHAVEGDPPP